MYLLCLTLLLIITLHLHRGRWCQIVCPTSGNFVTTRKDVFLQQFLVCCWLNQSYAIYQFYQWHTSLWATSIGLTLVLSQRRYINLQVCAFQSVALVDLNYSNPTALLIFLSNAVSVEIWRLKNQSFGPVNMIVPWIKLLDTCTQLSGTQLSLNMIVPWIKLLVTWRLSQYEYAKLQKYSFIQVVRMFFMLLYFTIKYNWELTFFCGGFPP